MTPRQQNIKNITDACIAANREIVWDNGYGLICREIRLADVLYALEQVFTHTGVTTKESYSTTFGDVISRYSLDKDSLDGQSDGTLEFLAGTLSGNETGE